MISVGRQLLKIWQYIYNVIRGWLRGIAKLKEILRSSGKKYRIVGQNIKVLKILRELFNKNLISFKLFRKLIIKILINSIIEIIKIWKIVTKLTQINNWF